MTRKSNLRTYLAGGAVTLSLLGLGNPAAAQAPADLNTMHAANPAPASTPQNPNRTLVNSTSIALNYRVDRVGPSGLGKVEIWASSDQGSSWRKLAEEQPRQGMLQINLPGEGLFGVRLVAVNGNGFGGNAPKRGDDPHFWVEVDSTPPLVQLGNIDPYTDGSNLTICWTAQDRNLGSTPISLYYRSEMDRTWQPIAKNLKNSGQHRWQFPRDKGERFSFRVEATDEAGNVCHAETPTPVALDMVEPQLIVVGVSIAEGRQQTAQTPSNFAPPPVQPPVQPQQNVIQQTSGQQSGQQQTVHPAVLNQNLSQQPVIHQAGGINGAQPLPPAPTVVPAHNFVIEN